MKPELIVESLNTYIKDKYKESLGHFVLQRTIGINPTFKAYKTYKAIMWYVYKRKKYKIFIVEITDKVISGQEEVIIGKLNKDILYSIFSLIDSESFNRLIKGEVKNYEII